MATTVAPADEIQQVSQEYKDQTNKPKRNRLVERYFPLVHNGERIWQRLPEGVELDDHLCGSLRTDEVITYWT